MITTKKIKLSSSILFKISLTNNAKKYYWMLILLWFFAIRNLFKNHLNTFDIYVIAISIILPIYCVIHFWRFSYSKENEIFFLERYYTINEEEFVGYLNDGNHNVIKNNYFIKYYEVYNSYLLYISKNQMIYIPKNSFKSTEDLNWFSEKILSKINKV